jgi:hypothetical protein
MLVQNVQPKARQLPSLAADIYSSSSSSSSWRRGELVNLTTLYVWRVVHHPQVGNLKTLPLLTFFCLSSDTLSACALASVGQFLRLWFFKEGFSV